MKSQKEAIAALRSASQRHLNSLDRRALLQKSALIAAGFAIPGCFAAEVTDGLVRTASMVEGPFYPDKLPLDTDNDLLLINDALNPGVGEITYLSGQVLGKNGQPIRNAFVEIWQCDSGGAYLHSGSSNKTKTDGNFQGYGRYLTDSQGRYFFRTIKPVPYPGRTPHIHFGVSKNGRRVLTTQMLVKGHPMNQKDFLFKRISNQAARDSLLVGFNPIKGSKIGELEANFDIVLGRTVQELDDGTLGGGLAKPDRAPS